MTVLRTETNCAQIVTGYIVDVLRGGRWWSFLYASGVNFINLLICLVGSNLFAKTTVFVFVTTTVCIASSFISFFVEPAMNVRMIGELREGNDFEISIL